MLFRSKYWHDVAARSARPVANDATNQTENSCTSAISSEQDEQAASPLAATAPADDVCQTPLVRDTSFAYVYGELMRRIQSFIPADQETEVVAISEARGRVTAESVVACNNVPNIDVAINDGWAIRSADTTTASRVNPCRLRMSSSQRGGPISEKETTHVVYGMAMPEGSDTVMAQY